jgi:error-prone DNA polymerase
LFCNVCSHEWTTSPALRRFRSIDELVRVVGLRRDEVTVLAEIGALNGFGLDRRSALWQAERAVRPAGELYESVEARDGESPITQLPITNDSMTNSIANDSMTNESSIDNRQSPINRQSSIINRQWTPSPLPPMGEQERLIADYAGSGLTIGRHPMAFRRHELSMRGVLRAIDLPRARAGRRVRTAGMVITRQRPGTAKGFVFLTLEDETGIANVIIRPDVYAATRLVVVESPFLLVEGILQNQDGVTSVRAERLQRLDGLSDGAAVESHDFH